METSRVGTYTSVDTIHSVVTGCDSIVTLTLRVDSVYDYTQNLGAFCQDTINTMREWIDDEGHSHGFVLDVSTTGLHTLGETHTTIHGCDSIYGVSWYVNPIYDFYEEKDLCENDTLEWEGMLFVGSQYAAYGKTYDPAPYDSVRGPLAHGIHHEKLLTVRPMIRHLMIVSAVRWHTASITRTSIVIPLPAVTRSST